MIMNGYIFEIHINCCFVIDNQVEDGFKYDLLDAGPLNMIGLEILNKVRAAVRKISSSFVPGQSSLHGKTLEPFFGQEIDYPFTL